jgi:nitroreductase
MDTLAAINKRRSIRKFTDKAIPEADLKILLKAAMMAPTGRNIQEWEFLVIRDKQTLAKITEIHPYAKMLLEAPAAIIVCANMDKENAESFWVGDCGAASQNILLAATELGIGSVWLGVQNNKERFEGIKKLFNLPANIMPFNIIALGYAAETKESMDRYDESKVHYEKWQKII